MKETTLKAVQANHDTAKKIVQITYTGNGLQFNTTGTTREECEEQAKEQARRVWNLAVVVIDNTGIG